MDNVTDGHAFQLAPCTPVGMKMNVYGLDHAALMRQVHLKLKRARGSYRSSLAEDPSLSPAPAKDVDLVAQSWGIREEGVIGIAEYIQRRQMKKQALVEAEREAERRLRKFRADKEHESIEKEAPTATALTDADDVFDEEEISRMSYLRNEPEEQLERP